MITASNIPYEILRRDDGAVALSTNIGEVNFRPSIIAIDGQDALISNDLDESPAVRLVNIPQDVAQSISEKMGIHFLEFSHSGRFFETELSLIPVGELVS